MMNKKGQILAVVTTGMVLAVALVALVIFGGVGFLLYLLTVNALTLAGIALLVFVGLNFVGIGKQVNNKARNVLLIIAVALLALPLLGDAFSFPLGAIVP